MSIISLIFAAGKGSRLQPLTDTIPKPLAPITDTETILDRHMRLLSPFVDRYIIVTHHLENQIIQRIEDTFLDIPVTYVHQSSPKWGTGDCLRIWLKDQNIKAEDQIFITNADEVLSQDTYQDIWQNLLNHQDFILGQKLEDHEKLKQFGIIQLRPDGMYDRIIEKPQNYISDLVNIGMYSVSGDILRHIPACKPDFLDDSQEEYIFIALDSYAKSHRLSVIQTTTWLTISNLDHLKYVQGFLYENPEF